MDIGKNIKTAFSKLFIKAPVLKNVQGGRVLLVTHNDMDASGAVICAKAAYGPENVDVIRCSNRQMSYEIKNAVCNQEIYSKYSVIFACDISCTERDAEIINKSRGCARFLLLDHHPTASHLNKYGWAVVESDLLLGTERAERYEGLEGGHSSGTSLMHDVLTYFGVYEKRQKELGELSPCAKSFLEEIVFNVASYDTWDWVNVFGESDTTPDKLDTLFKIYDADMFEEKMLSLFHHACLEISDFWKMPLFDEKDEFVLSLEEHRIESFLSRAKNSIKTGRLSLPSGVYDVAYATETSYVQELFGYMREHYPDIDLYMINCGGVISIRSVKEDVDAGKFAALYDGGGHPGAAGINVSPVSQAEFLGNLLSGEFYLDSKEEREARFVEKKETEEEKER